jgi:hypothetical protein
MIKNLLFIKSVIMLTLFLATCQNIFSTRTPEDPVNTRSDWIPAYTPEQVVTNFLNAITERNVENYAACFIDSSYSEKIYRFVPDPNVAADHGDIFNSWSLDKEEEVIRQAFALVPLDSTIVLSFTRDISEITASDSIVLVREYKFVLNHTQALLPTIFKGQSEFWLSEDSRGEWAIYHWLDNGVIPDFPSWSFLKVSLGGG